MSQDGRERELDDLYRKLDELRQENEKLQLERDITALERRLGVMGDDEPQGTPDHGARGGLKQETSTPCPPAGRIKFEARSYTEMDETSKHQKYAVGNPKQGKSKPKLGSVMKPATYDGTGIWSDYRAHFEACAEINKWSDDEKGLYLAVSLRGQAQGVLGNLSKKSNNYKELSTALEERFAPPNQTELYRCQLRDRRQKASESLAELAQDVRRLTNLAYASAPSEIKETLAKEQFIDSLYSSDIRLKVKQARPVDLNDAVRHAVELEAYYRAEQKKTGDRGILYATGTTQDRSENSEIQELKNTVLSLQKEFRSWKNNQSEPTSYPKHGPHEAKSSAATNRPQHTENPTKFHTGTRRPRRCYECGSEEHLKMDCPKLVRHQTHRRVSTNDRRPSLRLETKHKDEKPVKSSNFQGSGLYLTGFVSGKMVDCLVDTGATLTLVSPKVWNNVKDETSQLKEFGKKLVSASGDLLNIKGKTVIQLEIHGMKFRVDCVVADIDGDVILGLDFLKAQDGKLDLVNDTILLKGSSLKLSLTGNLGCHRVVVSERTEVPARSEVIVKGEVLNSCMGKEELCLVEPLDKQFHGDGGIIAKALVRGDNQIPLRVMNLSNETKTFYPGTYVGNASQVAEVQPVILDNKKHKTHAAVPNHLQDLYQRTIAGLDPKQRKDVASLLRKYAGVFSEDDGDIGRTGIIKHKIDTGEARPVKQPLRRVPMHMNAEVDSHIEQMLEKDVIQPSCSPWASGIVLVKKKDGSTRFCIDYRRLNDLTIKDAYPLPRIDECLNQLAGNSWFSCLDLNSGYWQVEVDENDREKTAFTSRKGLFEFRVMPFGLCNAPATFERLMETVLAGLQWEICLIYLDDVIVTGATFQEMIKNLSQVFERFQQAGLKLKPKKCRLFAREVEFLGHIVTPDGVHTDPKKTEAIQTWPQPRCVKDVRSFLGLCSYYRRFIFQFAEIAKPLHKLTEKGQQFQWTGDCTKSFEVLKQKLSEAPLLAHPDFSQPFILDTDASHTAIAAVLSQKTDGQEHVIAYGSRTLSKSERRYCVTRKEMLALIHFVKYFRHYLYGRQFLIRTDHSSLKWLLNFKNPEGQVARWMETLASYDMKIEHRPGRLHQNADALSRRACKQCGLDCDVPDRVTEVALAIDSQEVSDTTSTSTGLTELRTAQTDDQDVMTVKKWVEQGSRPQHKDIAGAGYFLKSLWGQFDRLEIRDNLLVRRWDVLGTNMVYWQAITPLSQRRNVLRYSHDIKASGHLGIKKTLHRIRQRYYWPGLQRDVKIYVNGCETCARRKGPNRTKKAPMQVTRSGYPMERIAVDILGELPLTENNNRYILVVSDYFTKWTESYPIPNMEASTVAKVMVEQLISRFGVPAKIHSDQGRQFESNLFSEMCRLLQIVKTRTTPYHPESDGMVERFNRTLCEMLSAYVQENHRDWDQHLPFVMMAYRAAEHETTGLSPNMLMLGRETATPLDLIYDMPSSIKSTPSSQWVWELQDRLESAHRFVREYTGRSIGRQKRYHDTKLSFEKLVRDDKVYVYFPVKKVGTSSKLTSFWKGPFLVKEKISDVLYKVDCGRHGSFQVIHVDRLRKARDQTLCGEGIPEPEGAETGSDTEIESSPEVQEEEPADLRFGKRERKKPAWHDDYCFSLFRSSMAKTKTTPRKSTSEGEVPPTICAVCKTQVPPNIKYEDHIKQCVMSRVKCDQCGCDFKNKDYLKRHVKAKHGNEQQAKASTSREDDKANSDWDSDPEVEITDTSDETLGRVVRKRTTPSPVLAPPRKVSRTLSEDSGINVNTSSGKRMELKDQACQTTSELEHKEVQADLKIVSDGQRCDHCGIVFEDIAMYYVHQGCHSCSDPFQCNVCGARCENRLRFQIHITRDHRQ